MNAQLVLTDKVPHLIHTHHARRHNNAQLMYCAFNFKFSAPTTCVHAKSNPAGGWYTHTHTHTHTRTHTHTHAHTHTYKTGRCALPPCSPLQLVELLPNLGGLLDLAGSNHEVLHGQGKVDLMVLKAVQCLPQRLMHFQVLQVLYLQFILQPTAQQQGSTVNNNNIPVNVNNNSMNDYVSNNFPLNNNRDPWLTI